VMGIAPVIAPLAGGLVSSQWGWRAVFWLHATIAALLWIWMALRLRETRPAETALLNLRQLLRGFAVLLRERSFMGYSLTYAFVSGASFVFVTVGAALFERLFRMTPVHFGLLWAGLALSYTVGAATAGSLAHRYGSARVLRVGIHVEIFAAGLLLISASIFAPHLPLYLLALALLMCGNGLVSPLALAGAVSGNPELAGVASGLSSALAMLISMLCAMISGLLFNGEPLRVAVPLALCCGLALLMSRIAVAAAPRTRLRRAT